MYGALLNLAVKTRKELKETVLTGPSFKLFLELEPNMREAINGMILRHSAVAAFIANDFALNIYF